MYPRNNASPERIAVGQVVLIADGTIQTSAVVITVRGQGGAEATGGGTTAYGAEGTVYYTPTQAETNFTSFVVIASKASCFSASQTVVTTASTTSGKVVLSGETHTSAVIPSVTLVATTTTNTDMRGTDGANTVVPDAAGTAPTAVEIRAEIDSNSTQLAAILADTSSGGIVKNAIYNNFEFPMVLTSDHYTAATSKTVTGEMSIDGAAFTATNGVIAEVGSGVYQIDLTAADTNGDTITYKFSATDSDDTIITVTTRS